LVKRGTVSAPTLPDPCLVYEPRRRAVGHWYGEHVSFVGAVALHSIPRLCRKLILLNPSFRSPNAPTHSCFVANVLYHVQSLAEIRLFLHNVVLHLSRANIWSEAPGPVVGYSTLGASLVQWHGQSTHPAAVGGNDVVVGLERSYLSNAILSPSLTSSANPEDAFPATTPSSNGRRTS